MSLPIIAVHWIEWIVEKQPQILRLRLLMNWPVEGIGIPLISQKARNEWGTELLGWTRPVHSSRNSLKQVKILLRDRPIAPSRISGLGVKPC